MGLGRRRPSPCGELLGTQARAPKSGCLGRFLDVDEWIELVIDFVERG
jgi:hypothetical protein